MNHCLTLGKYAVDRLIPVSKPENDVNDTTFSYTSADFKGQDYVTGKDILEGSFMIPLYDNETPRTQVGWISWKCLGLPDDLTNYTNVSVPVQEHLRVTLLNNSNEPATYDGCALSESIGGYYNVGKTYKFKLSDNNGTNVTVGIRNIGDGKRVVEFR